MSSHPTCCNIRNLWWIWQVWGLDIGLPAAENLCCILFFMSALFCWACENSSVQNRECCSWCWFEVEIFLYDDSVLLKFYNERELSFPTGKYLEIQTKPSERDASLIDLQILLLCFAEWSLKYVWPILQWQLVFVVFFPFQSCIKMVCAEIAVAPPAWFVSLRSTSSFVVHR